MSVATIQKFIVAAVGFLVQILAAGVLTGNSRTIVQLVVGVLQIGGVYLIPNKVTPSKTVA